MTNHIQVTLEIGPKGKKVVAVAPDWPGLERGETHPVESGTHAFDIPDLFLSENTQQALEQS